MGNVDARGVRGNVDEWAGDDQVILLGLQGLVGSVVELRLERSSLFMCAQVWESEVTWAILGWAGRGVGPRCRCAKVRTAFDPNGRFCEDVWMWG